MKDAILFLAGIILAFFGGMISDAGGSLTVAILLLIGAIGCFAMLAWEYNSEEIIAFFQNMLSSDVPSDD